MTIDTKSIFASRTLWINVAGLLIAVSGLIPDPYGPIALFFANAINRFYTTQAVSILGGPVQTDHPIVSGPPTDG